VISLSVSTSDYHTAGEPFRIVTDPPVLLPGDSVADRRTRALDSPAAQGLRKLLCFEPRGHADMYGGFLVPADDGGAHLGVLFWRRPPTDAEAPQIRLICACSCERALPT